MKRNSAYLPGIFDRHQRRVMDFQECAALSAYMRGDAPDPIHFQQAFFWCLKNARMSMLREMQQAFTEFCGVIDLRQQQLQRLPCEEILVLISRCEIRCTLTVSVTDPGFAQHLAECLLHPNCAIDHLFLSFPVWFSGQCGSLTAGLGGAIRQCSSLWGVHLEGPMNARCQLDLEFLEEMMSSPGLNFVRLCKGLRWQGMMQLGDRIMQRINERKNDLVPPIGSQMARAFAHAIAVNNQNYLVTIGLSVQRHEVDFFCKIFDFNVNIRTEARTKGMSFGCNVDEKAWITCEHMNFDAKHDSDFGYGLVVPAFEFDGLLSFRKQNSTQGRYVVFYEVPMPTKVINENPKMYGDFLCGMDLEEWFYCKEEGFFDFLVEEVMTIGPSHFALGIAMQCVYPVFVDQLLFALVMI